MRKCPACQTDIVLAEDVPSPGTNDFCPNKGCYYNLFPLWIPDNPQEPVELPVILLE